MPQCEAKAASLTHCHSLNLQFVDLLWHRAATIRRLGLEKRPDAEEEYEVSSGIVSILFPPESCETLHNVSSEARQCETALPGDLRLVNSFIGTC